MTARRRRTRRFRGDKERRGGVKERRGGVKERKGFRGDKEASKEMSEETMRSNRSIPIDNITCNQ